MEHTPNKAIVLKDGRTLGYAEYGEQKGTPILLFHGTPGSRLEGVLFERPAQAYHARIIVADRPGYATSSPLRHGSLVGYIEDMVALVDALQIDTFGVLGASGGGPFALACAAKIPERVKCCGLMSAIGPLTLPHSMDTMIAANRIMFTLARFLPALTGILVPRQFKSAMKSLQSYIDTGTSPLEHRSKNHEYRESRDERGSIQSITAFSMLMRIKSLHDHERGDRCFPGLIQFLCFCLCLWRG